MSVSAQGSSGTTPSSSGATETQTNLNAESSESVAYETHRKLLGEKKRRDEENALLKSELEQFKAKERAREEEELRKTQNFQQLLKNREDELAKEREEKASLRSMVEKGVKRRAFLDAVNGSVEEQYWGLINLDEILLDPSTGSVDELTVQKAAREFERKFAAVLGNRGGGPRLPNEAARTPSAKLTYEEWLKLPPKEMKARQKEVM